MTLTEFLLARIAEDEDVARWLDGERWHLRENGHEMIDSADGREVISYGGETTIGDSEHIARHDPARVLAECEAKRRIVELSWHHLGEADYAWGMEEAKRQILALMALPYADHPDYREEWRP